MDTHIPYTGKKFRAILTGNDSHAIWKKSVEADAKSVSGLWRHFIGEVIL
jgi:hypothetical protein